MLADPGKYDCDVTVLTEQDTLKDFVPLESCVTVLDPDVSSKGCPRISGIESRSVLLILTSDPKSNV